MHEQSISKCPPGSWKTLSSPWLQVICLKKPFQNGSDIILHNDPSPPPPTGGGFPLFPVHEAGGINGLPFCFLFIFPGLQW